MPQVIAAPPSAARPINLRTSARLVDDGVRWEQGVTFLAEECSPGGSVDPFCVDPASPKGSGDGTDTVTWMPYGIYTWASCTYAVNEDLLPELVAKARRSMEAQTSHLVEQIFWTGIVDGTDFTAVHPNVALTQTSTVGTPAPPVTALTQIDELLIAALGGKRGMIHVPMALLHQASFYNLLRKEGNTWETVTGNIVVPGTGYPGTNPDGDDDGNTWIYGTSMVELRLGDIFVPETTLSDALDTATNELVVRAERLALAYWDLCAHVGVPVCTPDPGPDCGAES